MQEGGANENTTAAIEEAKPAPDPGSSSPPPEHPPDAAKMVKTVASLTEFQTQLMSAGEQLIVIDFSATWCGPCKMIKPFFHSLSEKYPDVVFVEIDVDDAQDVAAHCDVKCMPTFQFYKNNKKVHEFSGANKEKLEETIKSLK
ncbi:thioredoxin-like [Rhineura floridana]|uniref:thioredoxin-like n=1 Tax=Rhineura floridana TaxID=261503 RepID=UPI002AC7F13C|nr:thioredoxin-like [Rhineura floridana]